MEHVYALDGSLEATLNDTAKFDVFATRLEAPSPNDKSDLRTRFERDAAIVHQYRIHSPVAPSSLSPGGMDATGTTVNRVAAPVNSESPTTGLLASHRPSLARSGIPSGVVDAMIKELAGSGRSSHMIIDRRTFIVRTALGAAAAALANLSTSSTAQEALLPGPVRAALAAGGNDRNCVVFKIDGWDCCDDVAIDDSNTSSADPVINDRTQDQVLIRINQSWRTTWR